MTNLSVLGLTLEIAILFMGTTGVIILHAHAILTRLSEIEALLKKDISHET